MSENQSRATVTLDGVAYEMPQDDLTLGESRILERYCEGNSDDEGRWGVAKLCGLIHVAVLRVRPQVPFDEVQAVIDRIELGDLQAILERAQADPPPSASSDDDAPDASSSTPDLELVQVNVDQNGSGSLGSPTTTVSSPETSKV